MKHIYMRDDDGFVYRFESFDSARKWAVEIGPLTTVLCECGGATKVLPIKPQYYFGAKTMLHIFPDVKGLEEYIRRRAIKDLPTCKWAARYISKGGPVTVHDPVIMSMLDMLKGKW